jgi:vacuolar fusion protein MON1
MGSISLFLGFIWMSFSSVNLHTLFHSFHLLLLCEHRMASPATAVTIHANIYIQIHLPSLLRKAKKKKKHTNSNTRIPKRNLAPFQGGSNPSRVLLIMSLTSSLTIAEYASSKDPSRTLWEHPQHVFIFTRAGKPVFSLHGNEARMSPLFALFQVLLSMGDDNDEDGGESHNHYADSTASSKPRRPSGQASSGTQSATASADEVRQVVYFQPSLATSSKCGVNEVQALALFFYVQGELMYVMAQRTAAPLYSSTQQHKKEIDETVLYASTPPPVASYCAAQLRHLHHFILLVLPTINTMLAQQPSLDVLSFYTEPDRRALRELIESYAARLFYAVGAMATLTLTVEKRRVVEAALLRTFRAADGPSDTAAAVVPPPAQQLFSFLFCQDYLVAAVGPPETYAAPSSEADRVAPLALGPTDACCGGLHVDDALLLYRYARSLVRRQVGEAWAPVCLPRFNSTGYLWCYAVNFSRLIRELRGERGLTVWPDLWTAGSEQEVLLIHVSASQDDFTPLSRSTRRFAQQLYAPAVGDDFYYRLEEEMCYRTPAPLAELLGPLRPSRRSNTGASPSSSSSIRTTSVPLWYGLVLQGGDPGFLASDKVAEPRAATEAAAAVAAAAVRSLPFTTADIRLWFESQPSPLLNLTTVDDVREFHQYVIRYQAQLRATPASASSPSMLLVRHSSSIAFALVQPTVVTLTALAQHFFHTKSPLCIPLDVDDGAEEWDTARPPPSSSTTAALDNQDPNTSFGHRHNEGEPYTARPSNHGLSFSAWVEAVRALGVTELIVAFAASTPDTLVWYWVARVLFMAVQRRARYVVRQLIGK